MWTNTHSSFKSFECLWVQFLFLFGWFPTFEGKAHCHWLWQKERKEKVSTNFVETTLASRFKVASSFKHQERSTLKWTAAIRITLSLWWKVVLHSVWIISLDGMGITEEYRESSCFLTLRKEVAKGSQIFHVKNIFYFLQCFKMHVKDLGKTLQN